MRRLMLTATAMTMAVFSCAHDRDATLRADLEREREARQRLAAQVDLLQEGVLALAARMEQQQTQIARLGGTDSQPTGPRKGDECPARFDQLTSDERSCSCAANVDERPVWGSGPYTTDSSICAAAVHAGVINANTGGKVRAVLKPGCGRYVGTRRNGIETRSWNEYPSSFLFEGQSATCPEPRQPSAI